MTKSVIDQLDELLATLRSYCGREVAIVESISRSRDLGHDRHFATRSVCVMRLREVGVAISGTVLTLDGEAAERAVYYQVALDAVVSADVESHAAVLVEQFERRTERRSEVTVVG